MAYNAELLANFEKEKKLLEVRMSELTKVAESRMGEIEKYKYEVKRLKDQVSGLRFNVYFYVFSPLIILYWKKKSAFCFQIQHFAWDWILFPLFFNLNIICMKM